jgi:hypothetical protein
MCCGQQGGVQAKYVLPGLLILSKAETNFFPLTDLHLHGSGYGIKVIVRVLGTCLCMHVCLRFCVQYKELLETRVSEQSVSSFCCSRHTWNIPFLQRTVF